MGALCTLWRWLVHGTSSVDRVEPVLKFSRPMEHNWDFIVPSTDDLAPQWGRLDLKITTEGCCDQARNGCIENVHLPCMVMDTFQGLSNCATVQHSSYPSHGKGHVLTHNATPTRGDLNGAWQVMNQSSLSIVFTEELSCIFVEGDQLTTALGQTYTMVAHRRSRMMAVKDTLLELLVDGSLQMTCKLGERALFERVDLPDASVLSDFQGKWVCHGDCSCRNQCVLTIDKEWWHLAKKHRMLHGFLHLHKTTRCLMLRSRTLQITSSGILVLEAESGRTLQYTRSDEAAGLLAIPEEANS